MDPHAGPADATAIYAELAGILEELAELIRLAANGVVKSEWQESPTNFFFKWQLQALSELAKDSAILMGHERVRGLAPLCRQIYELRLGFVCGLKHESFAAERLLRDLEEQISEQNGVPGETANIAFLKRCLAMLSHQTKRRDWKMQEIAIMAELQEMHQQRYRKLCRISHNNPFHVYWTETVALPLQYMAQAAEDALECLTLSLYPSCVNERLQAPLISNWKDITEPHRLLAERILGIRDAVRLILNEEASQSAVHQ